VHHWVLLPMPSRRILPHRCPEQTPWRGPPIQTTRCGLHITRRPALAGSHSTFEWPRDQHRRAPNL
jgi:hypothetical protein